jgi:hypothetical protein
MYALIKIIRKFHSRPKGTESRDFRPLVFFRQTIPLGPLIHGFKRFRILIRIRGVIRLQKSTPRSVTQRGVSGIYICDYLRICKHMRK